MRPGRSHFAELLDGEYVEQLDQVGEHVEQLDQVGEHVEQLPTKKPPCGGGYFRIKAD